MIMEDCSKKKDKSLKKIVQNYIFNEECSRKQLEDKIVEKYNSFIQFFKEKNSTYFLK